MNISEIFIRRPIATTLLMAGILMFGLVSYELLPVAALPDIAFPTIVVTAQLPGASPDTMAATVATPLEDQFTSIPGLAQMSSTSGLGSTSITLQFDLSRSIDGAAGDVQTAINAASGLLPKNLPNPPTYRKTNPADRPSSSTRSIRTRCRNTSSTPMPTRSWRSHCRRCRASGRCMSPASNSQQFTFRSIPRRSPRAVSALLRSSTAFASATLDSPKGNLEGPHQQFTLDTNDQLFNASQFRNIIVAYQNGAPVTVKDIGDVIDSSVNPRTGAWFDGKPCELLLIERAAGANTVQVVDHVQSMLPQLADSRFRAPYMSILLATVRRPSAAPSATWRCTLLLTIVLWFSDHLRLPAQSVGDVDPEHHRAAVDRRDLRRDVSVRLQHRQSVADGTDDRRRLRGRRRHCHDREHRALYRGRGFRRSRPRSRVPDKLASRSFPSHSR